ncbi:MAG: uroporphyrinogen decarboxylase [Pseudanabaenaceae cyanobacterium]
MTNDLLLRAARGEMVERPPVWMMRQAGRYMRVYRELRQKYPSFRERSENPELAAEISLQPWRAFQPDGVILFSDILTPLPGLGIDFDIVESQGPLIQPAIRTAEQIDQLTPFVPSPRFDFVAKALQYICQEVGDQATVLGFVGAPWTLAAYAVEGKSSKDYTVIKSMAYTEPQLLHKFLQKLAEAIALYTCFQIEHGAQVVQLFDSWAGHLTPDDYSTYALPYEQYIFRTVKARYPQVPLILYINGSAGILQRMAESGADIISLDWTVDMAEARSILGNLGVQGNLDPCVLFADPQTITQRTHGIIAKAGRYKHIMNLGHGILANTPEEHAIHFIKTVKAYRYS